jgi:hypothetical protein
MDRRFFNRMNSGTGILPVMTRGHRQDADATSTLSVISALSAVKMSVAF